MTFKYSIGDTVRHDDQEWLIVGAYRDNAPLYLAPRDRGPWYRLERRGAHSSVTCKVQESQLQPQYVPTCTAPFKAGDRVLWGHNAGTVAHVAPGGEELWVKRDKASVTQFLYTTVKVSNAKREPPRPIQVGDFVRLIGFHHPYRVQAMHGGMLWCFDGSEAYGTFKLENCELANG